MDIRKLFAELFASAATMDHLIQRRESRFHFGPRRLPATAVYIERPKFANPGAYKGSKGLYKRPTMRHTTIRRGKGDKLTNQERFYANQGKA